MKHLTFPYENDYLQIEVKKLYDESAFKPYLLNIMYKDIFDENVYKHSPCTIKHGDTVVDIGANIGMFTSYAIDMGAKQVYCFEPNERNFNCLKINTDNDKCSYNNCAVGSKDGELVLYEDQNIGGHSIYNNDTNNTKTGIKTIVNSLSINTILDHMDYVDFLKIDAEGAEYDIFKSITNENLQKVDRIALEWHHFIHNFRPYCEETIQGLKHKFNFYRLDYKGGHLSMVYFWRKPGVYGHTSGTGGHTKSKPVKYSEIEGKVSEYLEKKNIDNNEPWYAPAGVNRGIITDEPTNWEINKNFDAVLAHTSFLGHTGYNSHAKNFFTKLNDLIPTRIRNYTYTEDLNYLTAIQKDMVIEQKWDNFPYSVGTPFDRDNDNKNYINIILNESHHYYFYDKYEGLKIAYNVWESTRQIDEFFNQLLDYDQMWVPTEWQRQCTIDQGYPEDKIKVVPEGVDSTIFKPNSNMQRLPKHIDKDRFSFMIFGRWDYRKSIGEMIKAFLNAFNEDEPVDLIISVDNPFSVDKMHSTEERLKYYGLEDERIKILHFPSDKEYVKYLQSGNVFLSCARSEGWNLPLLEAIACGTVSICSNYGAQLEFAGGVSHLVDIKGYKKPTDFFLDNTENGVPGTWAEPDYEHLEDVIRDVHNNYDKYNEEALLRSKEVRSKFTWGNAASIAYKYLEELKNKETKPIQPGVELVEVDMSHLVPTILITINHLNSFRGSELYTYTLARELIKEFNIIIYSPDNDPEKDIDDTRLLDMFNDIGIPIIDDLSTIQSDVISLVYIQHNSTVEEVSKYYPSTPKILCSHGILPEIEQPPIGFDIDKYIAVSEEVKDNLENKGCKNVSIVRNFVDETIFNSEVPIKDIPKRALVISSYMSDMQKQLIQNSCNELDIEVEFVGSRNNRITPTELSKKIQQVDIVFSLGRGAIEAMMCGRIPIVFDYNGGDGMVTPNNFYLFMKKNFSGRTYKLQYNTKELCNVIEGYYKEYGKKLKKLALQYYSKNNVSQLTDIYKSLIKTKNINYNNDNEVFVIGCHADTDEKLKLLEENIHRVKEVGIPIIIVTHYSLPIYIQKQVDFILYEKENILSGEHKLRYWFYYPNYVKIVGDCKKGNYQAVAIVSLIRNAIDFCKNRYKYIHYIESDTVIDVPKYLAKARHGFRNKKEYVFFNWRDTITLMTNIFSFDVKCFDKIFDSISSWEEYLQVDVKRSEGLGRNGNWVFESWMHTLFEHYKLYNQTLLIDNKDRSDIVINSNVVDKGDEEPLLKVFLAETKANKIILFVINDSNNDEEYKLYKNTSLQGSYTLKSHNVMWSLWDKSNKDFTVKFESKLVEDLNISIDYTKMYSDTTFKFFDDTSIEALDWVLDESINKKEEEYEVKFNFINGCFLELLGPKDGSKFKYQIIDNDTNESIYEDILPANHYVKSGKEYYINYLCKISNVETEEVIFEHKFGLKDQKVLIGFDSNSLGDTIAWIPYAEEFRIKHDCTVIVSTHWNSLFEKEYSQLQFTSLGRVVHNLYAQYTLGCFEPANETNKSPFDYRTTPLQAVGSSILGLKYREIKPNITIPELKSTIPYKRYVCIGIHSTAQCKYWNCNNGWQEVVDYLNSKSIKVVLISKENGTYMGNEAPSNIIDKSGDSPLNNTIIDIDKSLFFIGLSSGLSWLSWAIGTPTIIISGHTKPWYCPSSNIKRIYNDTVCNGCYNDKNIVFDKGDWNWCPCNKDFECTRHIGPARVINAIKDLGY